MALDARNFLLHSDYPMDQIVGFMSGNMTVANSNLSTVDTAHNLSFTPLPIGSWSYTADFAASYPAITDYNGNGARPSVTIQANSSVLRVTVSNNTGATQTIYWRAFFLIPSTVDPDVAATAISSLRLPFSTDYNYTKLVSEGYVASTSTIPHNLGYRPQVACWVQFSSGFVNQYEISDARPSPTETIEVTTSSLIITQSGSYAGVHYRIYADGSS